MIVTSVARCETESHKATQSPTPQGFILSFLLTQAFRAAARLLHFGFVILSSPSMEEALLIKMYW